MSNKQSGAQTSARPRRATRLAALFLTLATLFTCLPALTPAAEAPLAKKDFTVTVTGAMVRLYDATVKIFEKGAAGEPIETKSTDFTGVATFSLEDDPAKSYTYEVSKTGYTTRTGDVDLSAGEVKVTLEWRAKRTIAGVVQDADGGAPIDGASVTLKGEDLGEEGQTETTEADGKFSFPDIYEGTYTLTVTKKEYKKSETAVDFERSDNIVIELSKKTENSLSFEGIDPEAGIVIAYNTQVTHAAKSDKGRVGIKYSVNEEGAGVVSVDPDSGQVTAIKPGDATITASLEENDEYLACAVSYKVKVVPAAQASFSFDDTIPEAMEWDDGPFTYAATGGSGDGKITYSIDSQNPENTATINPDTGALTATRPGTVTVKATKDGGDNYKVAEASYTIEFEKATQSPLAFQFIGDSDSHSVVYGGAFWASAIGGSTDEAIVYSISDEGKSLATVDAFGIVTPLGKGTVTVKAVRPGGDLYNDVEATYELDILPAERVETGFKIEGGSFNKKCGENNNTFTNPIEFGDRESPSEVSYSTTASCVSVDGEGVVTLKGRGIAMITATVAENEQYKERTYSYILFIDGADQEITFANDPVPPLTYGENVTYTNKASAKPTGTAAAPEDVPVSTITYSITSSYPDENTASIDSATGKVTPLKAGKVVITATAAPTSWYNGASASYTLTIQRADQTVHFEKGQVEEDRVSVEVTFNDNGNHFQNKLLSDEISVVDAKVSYKVTSGGEYVSADDGGESIGDGKFLPEESKGSFTILGAKTIVVEATIEETEQYNAATLSYTLTVHKDQQSVSFEKSGTVTVFAGHNLKGYNVSAPGQLTVTQSELHGEGAITYSCENDGSGDEQVIKSLTPEGQLELTYNAGSVTIKASVAEDENYEGASDSFTLQVKWWEPDNPDDYFTLDGDKNDPDNEWFTGDVTLRGAKGATVGFEHQNGSSDFEESHLLEAANEDGTYEIEFRLRSWNGDISSPIKREVKRDGTDPEGSLERNVPSVKYKLLEILTLGTWASDDPVTYTVKDPSDKTSNVASIEYYVDEGTSVDDRDILEEKDRGGQIAWKPYDEGGILIDEEDKTNREFVVYVKIKDNAGNVTYLNSAGTVYDHSEPVVVLEPASVGNTPVSGAGEGYWLGDVTYTLSVKDGLPTSGLSRVFYTITVNTVSGDVKKAVTSTDGPVELFTFDLGGDEERVSDYQKNDIKILSEGLLENDTVTLTVTAVDLAGNKTDDKLVMHVIDKAAVVTLSQIEENFYQDDREMTITIAGRPNTFDADKVGIHYTAKNARGDDVQGTVILPQKNDWTAEPDGSRHATVVFRADANYSDIEVTYTDPGVKESLVGSASLGNGFTVDRTDPYGKLVLADTTWSTLAETLTFGLYRSSTVHVSTKDVDDDTCVPAPSVSYIKTSDDTPKTVDDLEAETSWQAFSPFDITTDEIIVIYLKIVDSAGNTTYISSNGLILDTRGATITLTPTVAANENGYYNGDVPVQVHVEDNMGDTYAGLRSVRYTISHSDPSGSGSSASVSGSFPIEEKEDPTLADRVKTLNETITVPSGQFNADDIVLTVEAYDNAGNRAVEELPLKIDITAPVISLSYDITKGNLHTVNGEQRGYFGSARTATITITERSSTFDAQAATAGITFTAVDRAGNALALDRDRMISSWETHEGSTPDEATHTATVSFDVDGNYTLGIVYTDRAGNAAKGVIVPVGTDAPYLFTVDRIDPLATLTIESNSWDSLLDVLTFGIWSRSSVTVRADADDATSPFTVDYVKLDTPAALTRAELDARTDWSAFTEITVDAESADERFAVYLRVLDYAGNRLYVSSDGHIVEKTAPAITLTPDPTDIMHNGVGVYTGDVNVLLNIDENEPSSGIRRVEYWVTCRGVETARETLFSFDYTRAWGHSSNGGHLAITENGATTEQDGTTPGAGDLVTHFARTIVIDAEENNSCDVVLSVAVTDNAGNYTGRSIPLDIDITRPTISLSFDNNAPRKIVSGRGYYPAARTATVTITERSAHFSEEDARAGIAISAFDSRARTAVEDVSALISDFTTAEGGDENSATHTATIAFTQDANYTLSLSYTDIAALGNEAVDTGSSETPYFFTVDTIAPTGSVFVDGERRFGSWEGLVQTLTFGLWSRDTLTVSGTSDDATSPIESFDYIKTSATAAMTISDLDAADDWQSFTGLEVASNERFVVYLRIIDNAGNTTYLSTDGVVVDDTFPVVENIGPEITVTPPQPVNGFYNSDITVAVRVVDPIIGETGAYSGLAEVRYEVLNLGEVTQSGVLYNFPMRSPTQADLVQTWESESAIVVDRSLNNSNFVTVRVFARDNAGNESEKEQPLQIDTTAPTISVIYDNNDGDTTFAGGTYFKDSRAAVISIVERNFNPDKVSITVLRDGTALPVRPTFTSAAGRSANGDDAVHTATVSFDSDGDYSFAIAYTDEAGNASAPVSYGSSLSPTVFTVDRTSPTLSVEYDNNEVRGGSYYKASRTATLTLVEHNFEPSRAQITLSASDDGATSDLPVISDWTSSGDTHTLTISYDADSLYTFDFDYTDMAGNRTVDIEQQSFTVDKTAPRVIIRKSLSGQGSERDESLDQSANNQPGNIGFVIDVTDTNFERFVPSLKSVTLDDQGFAEENLNIGEVGTSSDISHGASYAVQNLEQDGIYTIRCEAVDKAGNAYTEIHLLDKEGKEYTEDRAGSDDLVTFSVNRDGSTFRLDEATTALVQNYYVPRPSSDIVIEEINPDALTSQQLSVNEKALAKDSAFSIEQSGGDGQWMRYTYKVPAATFENEGQYKVVVSSHDKAGNDAFSDVKKASIEFVVDRTAPLVTVSGLREDGRYRTDRQRVTLTPVDDGGALSSLIVRIVEVDRDGNVTDTVKEILNLSGEELQKALEEGGGSISFELEEGLFQNVQILCTDSSGEGNVFEQVFTDVSVSASGFMIFWANKPLRWGIIGGVGGILLLLILFLIFRRKKKDEDESAAPAAGKSSSEKSKGNKGKQG